MRGTGTSDSSFRAATMQERCCGEVMNYSLWIEFEAFRLRFKLNGSREACISCRRIRKLRFLEVSGVITILKSGHGDGS